MIFLYEFVKGMFLCWLICDFGFVLVDGVLVKFMMVGIDVYLVGVQLVVLFLEVVDDLEEKDDGEGEIYFEEIFGGVEIIFIDGSSDSSVELGVMVSILLLDEKFWKNMGIYLSNEGNEVQEEIEL